MSMSEKTSGELTILFADVAGSIELYTALGDVQAHQLIVDKLKFMTACIERHRGRVVETIGDEIMCAFTDPDCALSAACEIQECLHRDRKGDLDVRVGLHSGATSMANGRPFGDTVNIAARVVELAKAGQIMLTDQACRRLSESGKLRTRFFTDVYIKGKRWPYTIHQALWDLDDRTLMVDSELEKPVERRQSLSLLSLRYRESETRVEEGSELLLGRGEQCSLRINSETASRIHAIVKCHAGRLILTDRSTNGTFIRTMSGKRVSDNQELYFHHDEWTTNCSGVISLGQPVSRQNPDLVHFNFS